MPILNHKDFEDRMNKSLDAFKSNLAGLRTGRASAGLVDNLKVNVYGSMMPLSQVATISVPEPRCINVQVWDKGNVQAVEKAVLDSNLGLNPATSGELVRLPIPDLTEERRKELVKMGSGFLEDCKISIRNIRKDLMDAIKKGKNDGDLTEDEMHSESDEAQKLTDAIIAKADEIYKEKEADIMTV